MITSQAIEYGDVPRLLNFNALEHPVALQLGGSDPHLLAKAAKRGEEFGYDEINLNAGCPSPRVSAGRFGACLMFEPVLVADCIAAMRAQVTIPVTVKCRIGVDDQDRYETLCHFIETVASAGCQTFILHARKAWLKGLSPKQNREIPPLRYEIVQQIKRDFPHLTIILNGGIKTIEEIDVHLTQVDGVMIGREAYTNPYFLAAVQAKYFHGKDIASRAEIIQQMLPYIQEQMNKGVRLGSITRHLLGLFQGERGAAIWRRYLSQNACLPNAGSHVLEEALSLLKLECEKWSLIC